MENDLAGTLGDEAVAALARGLFQARFGNVCTANQFSLGVMPRIGCHQSVLVGQDNQQIRFNQVADQPGESVVIAQ